MKGTLCFLLIIGIVVCGWPGPAAAATGANSPEVYSVNEETVIHLPGSVKYLLVERYEPKTNYLEKEIREYTNQQAVFWTIATLVLMKTIVEYKK